MKHINTILQNKDLFTPGELKIAEFILENPGRVKQFSSPEMADVLGISQSSIIKFAQKLGFKGFTKFKIALVEEWGQQSTERKNDVAYIHNEINSEDSFPDIAEKLMLEKQQALRDTSHGLDFSKLQQVVEMIRHAGRVQITAIGGSSLIAKDLAYKLMKIGYPVMNEMDSHVQITVAQSLMVGDVQIAISFSGQRREVQVAAEAAKARGAKIIVLTSLHLSPLRQMADVCLDTIAEGSKTHSSSIAVRTSQHTLIDLLFVCLLQQGEAGRRELIEQSRTLVNKL
ncbi:SIS domain-containing protein [Scandinavium goeteborgense]|nr:SIS domain-containing protein [Scandinavium goeteborgense]